MGVGLSRIQQIKIPVSDLKRSVSWYRSLFDLELAREFVEQGVLRGAVLIDRDSDVVIALRDRAVVPGRPEHTGFDLFALQLPSRAALESFLDRCDRLDVPHTDIHDRGIDGAAADVPDPDGTVVRLIWPGERNVPGFAGIEFGEDGTVSSYDTPRLGT